MIQKILLIQTASLGDVVLATSLLEKLHTHFPEAEIDLLIKKGYEGLFTEHPFLNELWIWDKTEAKYQNLFRLIKQLRKNAFDTVINLQRFAATGLITNLIEAKTRIGFSKNPLSLFYTRRIRHFIGEQGQSPHETVRNHALIVHLTNEQVAKPRLYPSKNDSAKVSQYKTKTYICIAPASLWFTKQYPEDKWVELMQNISPHFHIYLLGSKADFDLCNRIIEKSHFQNSINLSGKLSLLESAALMRDAHMNFVNDSAPMHLCSAVNAPVTAIYCSTVPEFGFGPLSADSAIVQTDEQLECRPCGLHGWQECPKKHFRCATSISTQKLLARI
ncbi:MAG: glycosyltransferase family 9 protein [Bacteroidetes bacterium]|nr:glycosyltransferase family 9 protein [Bacteroidota bacterium]MBU1578051.1 glycosyltransferase family 9 protein [Bacteroidota bacterium]MBU2559178.1 glycosyltransferase family 9 protein [Bacteroidota bacterium]